MKAWSIISTALLAVVTLYLAVSWLFGSRMAASSKASWTAMQAAPFVCSVGAELRTDGWGKSGYSRSCALPKEGEWEAWEDGYKHISGTYRAGKEHGRWTYYNRDGSVSRIVEYSEGLEVPSSTGP
jgi:hypothetical protein